MNKPVTKIVLFVTGGQNYCIEKKIAIFDYKRAWRSHNLFIMSFYTFTMNNKAKLSIMARNR